MWCEVDMFFMLPSISKHVLSIEFNFWSYWIIKDEKEQVFYQHQVKAATQTDDAKMANVVSFKRSQWRHCNFNWVLTMPQRYAQQFSVLSHTH